MEKYKICLQKLSDIGMSADPSGLPPLQSAKEEDNNEEED
tara:strand:+ start:559 stop:678 length:120 start_codon:yes stop_codon:yes gene_type:complete